MGRTILDRLAGVDDQLEPDEEWVGAQSLTIVGAKALSARLADVDISEALPELCNQHGVPEPLTVADDAIPNAFLVALTTQRVLVFARSITGKPKALEAECPMSGSTLDVIDHGDRARARVMVFGRPDGSVFAGEAGINGPAAIEAADEFVSHFRGVRA